MEANHLSIPVVVFAYKRVDHLRRLIESLAQNAEAAATPLYFYCDGAKRPDDQPAVDKVRSYVSQIQGFASVASVFRPQNFGLAESIITGVSEILQTRDRVIVLEDDLVLSPYFLRYMIQALTLYENSQRIASIHGYCYPVDLPLPETFFLRGADCWGWATWARAWRHFEPDGEKLLAKLRADKLTQAFDLDGGHPYTTMLEDQVAGRNDSWAIRWHASCFVRDMLTLYPGRTLVENIGNDSSGTHCVATDVFSQAVAEMPAWVAQIPLTESVLARKAFARFLKSQQPSLLSRAKQFLRGAYEGAT